VAEAAFPRGGGAPSREDRSAAVAAGKLSGVTVARVIDQAGELDPGIHPVRGRDQPRDQRGPARPAHAGVDGGEPQRLRAGEGSC
jgi:hypothetical protein